MGTLRPLNVFLTIDTEVWPRTPDWRKNRLGEDIQRDIYGVTRHGDFGIGYQISVMNTHGLKAVFFLESLFADAVGIDALRNVLSNIQQAGHDVQLHLHPEWLAHSEILPAA